MQHSLRYSYGTLYFYHSPASLTPKVPLPWGYLDPFFESTRPKHHFDRVSRFTSHGH